MKRLIKNNFLYYRKSRTKIIISICFVLSFFVMVFVYDRLELDEILLVNRRREQIAVVDYEKFDFEDEYLNELVGNLNSLESGYFFLHASGRMNYELTPYRHQMNQTILAIYEHLGDQQDVLTVPGKSLDTLKVEGQKLDYLQNHLIADDFSKYTITAANFPSKVFEGPFLFVILVFALILFYDLFSKDFDLKTYRTVYSSTDSRQKIVLSKIVFALLYFTALIIISILFLRIYLLLIKRSGYNVIPSRAGSLLHPRIMNLNFLSFISREPILITVPTYLYNFISVIYGLSLIYLWISFISLLSFKLKSSNNTLIISTYSLFAIYASNESILRNYLIYFLPIVAFDYHSSLSGEHPMNIMMMFIINIVLTLVIHSLLNKNLNTMDLLDGNHND